MEELKCPICGEPTRIYMGNARKDKLCGKHADMLKKGDIVIDDEGLFVDAKTNKILNKDYKEKEDKEYKGVAKCIACGKEVQPGFFFCKTCYAKYIKKELLVRIKNCKEITILDESYEGHYVCDDGHIVKSKSERDIDNYLFENNIPHAYERAFVPESDPSKTLKPDFTLPNFKGSGKDVFIEHWGYNDNNIEYTKSKKYKIDIYKKEKVTIVSTYEKDIQDYKVALKKKLATFEYDKINFEEK